MAIVISGNGIDMGGNPVSNASQVDSSLINASQVDSTVINENGSNVVSQGELAYDVDTSSYIPNTLASGAIIERGSNANGEYVKFADGTLICNAVLPEQVGYSWPSGTWFKASNFPLVINGWTYPSAFSAVPNVHISSLNDAGATGNIEGILSPLYSTSAIKALFDGKATTNITRIAFIRVVAIGRWK